VAKAPSCRRASASRYVSVTWSVAGMRLASTCSRSSRLSPLDQKMWPGCARSFATSGATAAGVSIAFG
jgi:hypothetical protein